MTALATATNPDMPPGWWALPRSIPAGAYLWPVWGPLPDWLPPGHWLTGLATGLAGAAVGTFMLRGARALFSKALGREALGLGDADLMMMAGAFLGWQPIVVAFFVGAFAALVLMVPLSLMRGEGALPFGPGLALGLVITWLAWPSIGPSLQPIFFDALTLGVLLVFVVPVAFLLAFVMGRLRGQPVEDDHVPVGS
jgi:leader peptidase (prepilin peptidase)/N-methyltransferase